MACAIATDFEIRSIAGVRPRGVVETVLFAEWVVVRAGRREWCSPCSLAPSDGVEMDTMYSRREVHRANIHVNSAIVTLPQLGGSDSVAADIIE